MVTDGVYGIRRRYRKVLFFVSGYQGGQNFKTIALWSIRLGVEKALDLRQCHSVIGPGLDRLDSHEGTFSLNRGRVNLVVTRMGPNEAHIDNPEPILDCHDQPVVVALEVENHPII